MAILLMLLLMQGEIFGGEMFDGKNITIASGGHRYLGAVIGDCTSVESFRVKVWMSEIKVSSEFAMSQPHVAYAAFNHELHSKWTYCLRTISESGVLLEPQESLIHTVFLPPLTGQGVPNQGYRDFFALTT